MICEQAQVGQRPPVKIVDHQDRNIFIVTAHVGLVLRERGLRTLGLAVPLIASEAAGGHGERCRSEIDNDQRCDRVQLISKINRNRDTVQQYSGSGTKEYVRRQMTSLFPSLRSSLDLQLLYS